VTKKRYMELIELPTDSFFGEYQIVLKLKSMFIYKSNEGEDTSTMCINNKVLLQLLEEYPKIKNYWEEKGIERRREFTRRAKIAEFILQREYENDSISEDDDNFEEIPVYPLNHYIDELETMNFDDDELNNIPPEEKMTTSLKKLSNSSKKAQQGLDVIEDEIDKFNEILESHQDHFENNLQQLSDFVKDSRQSPDSNLQVPEMLLSENSPSEILRNFIKQTEI
jgi:DNA repair ATPase RecN